MDSKQSFKLNTTISLVDSEVYQDEMMPIALKNSEYDQEIPQSQTADKPMALWGSLANYDCHRFRSY